MVDTEAPTTFDLGPTPQADPLGATVLGTAPDLNKTVAGTQPPLTSEIPPSAPTRPTPSSPPWQGTPPPAQTPQPPSQPIPTGPTTTSRLATPPTPTSPQPLPPSPPVTSGGLGQTSAAPLPQTGQVSGAPVMMTPAPQPGAPGVAAPAAPPQKKSSRLPLVIGGLAVLFLLVIGGGAGFYFFVMRPKAETANNSNSGGGSPTLERDSGAGNTNASSNANSSNANTSAPASQPPVTPPPNSTRFVSSRDKMTGSLAEHFIDFSLYYPNGWTVDTKAGTSGSSNFFKADRMLSDDTGDYLLESAAVSWYQSNGTMQLDRPIFPNRVEFFNNLFSKDYPNYQKVSEGETRFNGLDAYQFTFKGLVKGTGKGDINLWGRVIFLPLASESARNGVVLLMLASSAAPEIKSADDVGEKGELPTILKTFRLGP
jgi:hypothetical protein